MTSASTDPNISPRSGFWNIRQIRLTASEIAVIINSTCLADSFAFSLFLCPIYYAQTIAPPAASAENAWITNTLIESTSDTAEIAADPTLLTIIVSAVPVMEFKWKKDLPLVRFYTHYSRPTSSCKALIKKSDKYHHSDMWYLSLAITYNYLLVITCDYLFVSAMFQAKCPECKYNINKSK